MSNEQMGCPDGDDWIARKPGAQRASSRHDTQREADRRAAEIWNILRKTALKSIRSRLSFNSCSPVPETPQGASVAGSNSGG